VDRLFLDANVLFSAAYRPEASLTRLWKLRDLELLTSSYAAEEARINLSDGERRQRLALLLKSVSIVMGVSLPPTGIKLPEKDRPILQAAIHAQATHLLTGDKRHFGQYFGRHIGSVLVLTPADYLRHR
jgi:predicted nucleic acid-binding protein